MADFAFPTNQDIIQEVQTVIGEVAGPGVQIYSEDQAYAALHRSVDIIFIKRPWEHYLRWGQYTLDGVNGKITDPDPFGDVVSPDLSDFIYVGRSDETRPMPLLNNRINPLTIGGGTVAIWGSLPISDPDWQKKRLQFWPKASDPSILVNTLVRLKPTDYTDTGVLYFDRLMLVMGTAWQILDFDGTNPNAADTCKQLFDLRFRDIEHSLAGHPLQIISDKGIPTEWFVPYP